MQWFKLSFLSMILVIWIGAVSLQAKSITLFPPSYALISQRGQTLPLGASQSVIRAIPAGIILPHFTVLSPPDVLATMGGFWSRDASDATSLMINRTVVINGQSGILIAQTPDLWVVQHPDRLATYSKSTPVQAPDVVATRTIALPLPGGTPVEWAAIVDTMPSTMRYTLQLDGAQSRFSAFVQVQNNTLINLENMSLDIKVGGQLFDDTPPGAPVRALQSTKFDSGLSQTPDMNQYYYAVSAPVSLLAGQTYQIPLFDSVKLKPQVIFRLESRRVNLDGSQTQLQRILSAKNTTGYPLAPGPVQLISDGKLVAIGNVAATAIEGEFRIPFGAGMDVAGTRRVTGTTLVDRTRTESIEFNVLNASNKVAVVEVVETTWGSAEVVRASQGYRRVGQDVVFEMRLGPKAAQTVSVTIRYPQ